MKTLLTTVVSFSTHVSPLLNVKQIQCDMLALSQYMGMKVNLCEQVYNSCTPVAKLVRTKTSILHSS